MCWAIQLLHRRRECAALLSCTPYSLPYPPAAGGLGIMMRLVEGASLALVPAQSRTAHGGS